MVGNIKTTIDIAPVLLMNAKKVAAENKITLRELTEEGLELVLEKRRQAQSQSLRIVSFGNTKNAHVLLDWEKIRDLIYP